MMIYWIKKPIQVILSLIIILGTSSASIGQESPGTWVDDKGITTFRLENQGVPPHWALLERQLFDQLYPAALEFIAKYTNPDGTLNWRDEWPGIDGSDDGYESFYNYPLFSALGGSMKLDSIARHLWDGVTRQFTGYGQ
ncbi:MAG: hypothetical protein HKN87_03910, partial [Saprospiraceae bacterium]|nr:hypothetical protein [Saprospiraceae bacterium]